LYYQDFIRCYYSFFPFIQGFLTITANYMLFTQEFINLIILFSRQVYSKAD